MNSLRIIFRKKAIVFSFMFSTFLVSCGEEDPADIFVGTYTTTYVEDREGGTSEEVTAIYHITKIDANTVELTTERIDFSIRLNVNGIIISATKIENDYTRTYTLELKGSTLVGTQIEQSHNGGASVSADIELVKD